MRSRRDSTSGEGLKSTVRKRRHPAIAGEELAPGLEQPGELDVIHLGQGALQDPGALTTRDLRGDGQEELVRQPSLTQPAVQGRASFAEDGADAALVPQPVERAIELDTVGMPHDCHRRRGLRRLAIGRSEDDDTASPVGEEGSVPGQFEAVGDDHAERVMGEAGPLAVGA
jgi:hypothetical protein